MSSSRVKGLGSVIGNLNSHVGQIKGKTGRGLLKAGLFIEGKSKPLVPVLTGNLRGSGYTRKTGPLSVEVGYSAAYAIYVHENLEARHTNGEAKFLQRPLREHEDKIIKIVADEAHV
jgi:hypothetical protein